jgi:hypothetical protein
MMMRVRVPASGIISPLRAAPVVSSQRLASTRQSRLSQNQNKVSETA